MKLTLLQKPGQVRVDDFAAALQNNLLSISGGLSAAARFAGFSREGWAQVNVSGEDHEILEELISRELDLARTALTEIELQGNYPGRISGILGDRVAVNLGIEMPKPVKLSIALGTLGAQLCDGKRNSMEDITESYCLQPEAKIAVRITRLQSLGTIDAWLADSQIASFAESIRSNLQSVYVYYCTQSQLESAVTKAGLERDIIGIRSLTLTSHCVSCKLGTDAIGLIPRLGSILRRTVLKPFIPSRIITRCRKW
jgi:hypothetical protein